MVGKITIVVSFKMMHYISQCSSLCLQAVFNGVLQTVGDVDLQEVKTICSGGPTGFPDCGKSISECRLLISI